MLRGIQVNYPVLLIVTIFLTVLGLVCLNSCLAPSGAAPGEQLYETPPSIIGKQQPSTDISAPIISAVSVAVTDNNSVVTRWITDEEGSSEIKLYDVSGRTGVQSVSDAKFLTDHKIVMDGNMLKPGITYSLSVISRDRAGNMATHDNAKMLSVNMLAAQNKAYRIFNLPALNGGQVSLVDFKGKQVLLHFWLYGCPACEEELPLLNTVYNSSTQNELPLVTISIQADAQQVTDYVKSHSFKFPVLFDLDGNVTSAYNIGILPTTYIVDDNGTIIKKKEGKFDSLYDIREFMGQKSFIGGF